MAKQLNYPQNHLAAALKHGRTDILGIIVPTLAVPVVLLRIAAL